MRAFLIWAESDPRIIDFIFDLKKNDIDVVYWVGLDSDRSRIPDVVFHNHYSAWAGNPAPGINAKEFEPLGRELIERFYKIESIVLSMMNKRFDTLGVDERR